MQQKIEKAANDLDFYKHRDDTHPQNLFYEPPVEEFYGPVNSEMRSCTDYICIFFWLAFLIFSLAYGYYAFIEFNIEKLYRSNDFRYDLCGYKQLANKPYAYFLDPNNLGNIAICVSTCPSTADYTEQICLYDVDGVTLLDDYCYDTYYTDAYNIYCMPLKLGPRRDAIEAIISTDIMIARRIAGDFYINLQLIVQAFALQIGIGFIFIIILLGQKIAHIMIWGFVTGFCISVYYQAAYVEKEQQNAISKDCLSTSDPYQCIPTHLYFLDFVKNAFIAIIPICVTLFVLAFHKILMMVQIMEHMLKPLRQMPYFLLIPLFVSVLQGGLGVIYILLFIGGVNSGQVQTISAPTGFSSSSYRDNVFQIWQGQGFYVITFFYFWTLQAMYYFVRTFIACCCSVWYYSRDKNYLNAPILRPLWFMLRYHIGSFLLGAILIPLFWMFNGFFYFWKLGLENMPRKSFILSILLFMSTPGFWVYEYAGKYITHRNYMHISIYADNFWLSGLKVFYLRERNYSRVEMIRYSLGYVRVIGMMFISSAGSYLVYYSLYDNQLINRYVIDVKQQTQYPIVPALFSFITGLYIAQNFSSVIDVVAETMNFDLIADEEMFMGQQRFADQDMMDFVNKYSKEKQKKDFVITNQGQVNPINDNPDMNDIIKPININDLMNQDQYSQEEEELPEEPKEHQFEDRQYESDDELKDAKIKEMDLDDLDALGNNADDKDQDYEDENVKHNKNRRRAQDGVNDNEYEEDVIELDKNKVEKQKAVVKKKIF